MLKLYYLFYLVDGFWIYLGKSLLGFSAIGGFQAVAQDVITGVVFALGIAAHGACGVWIAKKQRPTGDKRRFLVFSIACNFLIAVSLFAVCLPIIFG